MGKERWFSPLKKNEVVIGLGGGRELHIDPAGKVESVGIKYLPPEAFLFLPLVVRIAPSEFMGPGDFTQIQEMEDKLGESFGSPEDVYEAVGPFLVSKGIPARRVAKALIDISPIKTMNDTAQISDDVYYSFVDKLEDEVKKYYPGLRNSMNRRFNFARRKLDTGTHKGPDGISF